jgi:hypothetical protein
MPMTKSKHGRARAESRDSKAERIYAAAMEIVEIDARDMRAKIERLRTLRLAREGGAKHPERRYFLFGFGLLELLPALAAADSLGLW